VFFKGCPLRCIWCHNPETWEFQPQLSYNAEKCTKCLRCVDKCPHGAISTKGETPSLTVNFDFSKCTACGNCAGVCLSGAIEICGRQYSVTELFDIIKKDITFYEQSGGGVTFSGGESMSQDINFITELAKKCHKLGINVNIDTCGFTDYDNFKKILPYVDTFLYDIKVMDSDKHKAVTEADNKLILENIKKLNADGAKIHVRIPLIEGINCDDENISSTIEFLKQINVYKVTLLPFHSIGIAKYERLGLSYSDMPMKEPDKDTLKRISDKFLENNLNADKLSLD